MKPTTPTLVSLIAGLALSGALPLACNGDGDDDGIIPKDESDADTDSDADADADADSDADTDVPLLCEPLLPPTDAVTIASGTDLVEAIGSAAPGSVLALEAGTYEVSGPVSIDRPLTLLSGTGNRDDVVIDGVRSKGNLFEVSSSDVVFAHLTLANSGQHLVSVRPAGSSITGPTLHDVHLLDAGRTAVTVVGDDAGNWVDDGTVSCSRIELTREGQDFTGGACSTAGIDVEGARGWTVRDNHITGLWCPNGTPGPAIRFTRGSRDATITRNVINDVSLGIIVGETQDQVGRTYPDIVERCGKTVMQSVDAVVSNNIVSAYEDELLYSSAGVVAGIRAESSCDVAVIHNSVYAREKGAFEPGSSIEMTFETTTGIFANNLMSHAFRRIGGAAADETNNVENAPPTSWFFAAEDDFHTAPAAKWAIDQGSADYLDIVDVDIDNQPRSDGSPDVGADEQ